VKDGGVKLLSKLLQTGACKGTAIAMADHTLAYVASALICERPAVAASLADE
jgi:hypothetical protein